MLDALPVAQRTTSKHLRIYFEAYAIQTDIPINRHKGIYCLQCINMVTHLGTRNSIWPAKNLLATIGQTTG